MIMSRVTWSFVALLAVIAIALLVIYVPHIWDWLRSGGSGPGEPNGTTLRNIGLLAAGIIALPLALWRSWVADRQAKSAEGQLNATQQSLRQERYQRGAEILGNELLSARMGGIYALQRLAVDYPEEYHIQVMELLCAFVRNPTGQQEGTRLPPSSGNKPSLREDVQAVMTAIGERSLIGKTFWSTLTVRVLHSWARIFIGQTSQERFVRELNSVEQV